MGQNDEPTFCTKLNKMKPNGFYKCKGAFIKTVMFQLIDFRTRSWLIILTHSNIELKNYLIMCADKLYISPGLGMKRRGHTYEQTTK